MNKTLLQRAKAVKVNSRHRVISDEYIDLALAWIRDEIGLTQVNVVLGKKREGGNSLYGIAVWLREAYRNGKIIIK